MDSVLVKFKTITMNGNAEVCGRCCDRFCFWFKALMKPVLSKASGLYYE